MSGPIPIVNLIEKGYSLQSQKVSMGTAASSADADGNVEATPLTDRNGVDAEPRDDTCRSEPRHHDALSGHQADQPDAQLHRAQARRRTDGM